MNRYLALSSSKNKKHHKSYHLYYLFAIARAMFEKQTHFVFHWKSWLSVDFLDKVLKSAVVTIYFHCIETSSVLILLLFCNPCKTLNQVFKTRMLNACLSCFFAPSGCEIIWTPISPEQSRYCQSDEIPSVSSYIVQAEQIKVLEEV